MTICKQSLAVITTKELYRRIDSGLYRHTLPGEKQLAHDLGVSRPVLRDALNVLRSEGIIETQHGVGSRIIEAKPGACLSKPPVVFVSGRSSTVYDIRTPIITGLLLRGYATTVRENRNLFQGFSEKWLNALIHEYPQAIWVIAGVSPKTQQYFADRALQTLVAGTTHDGIDLPCVDRDSEAVASHAAGLLKSKEYRSAVVLARDSMAASDRLFVKTFQDRVRRHGLEYATVTFGNRERTESSILQCIKQMPSPIGFIALGPNGADALLLTLSKSSVRVPQQAGVICRVLLHRPQTHSGPSVSGYYLQPAKLIQATVRLINKMATTPATRMHPTLLIPDYHKGDSL